MLADPPRWLVRQVNLTSFINIGCAFSVIIYIWGSRLSPEILFNWGAMLSVYIKALSVWMWRCTSLVLRIWPWWSVLGWRYDRRLVQTISSPFPAMIWRIVISVFRFHADFRDLSQSFGVCYIRVEQTVQVFGGAFRSDTTADVLRGSGETVWSHGDPSSWAEEEKQHP